MNKVLINATLTRDIEMSFGQSGKAYTSFSVAYNHGKDDVSYFDCKAWGKTAEFLNQWFRQGDGVNLEGDLRQDRWEDKNGGGKRSKVLIHVQHATFPKGKKGGGNGGDGGERQPAPRRDNTDHSAGLLEGELMPDGFDPDAIPF